MQINHYLIFNPNYCLIARQMPRDKQTPEARLFSTLSLTVNTQTQKTIDHSERGFYGRIILRTNNPLVYCEKLKY